MERTHSLLMRQVKRYFGPDFEVPGEWREFIDAVGAAYGAFDEDREMLERSLDLSSQELLQANAEMRALLQSIPDLIIRLDEKGEILKANVSGSLAGATVKTSDEARRHQPEAHLTEAFRAAVARVVTSQEVAVIEYKLSPDTGARNYEARLVPLRQNEVVAFIRDITRRHRSEALRTEQNRLLEMIVSGAPVEQTLVGLAKLIESQASGMLCSVLVVEKETQRLRACAAPSLSPEFLAAIDGIAVGDETSPCGAAAKRKQTVIVADATTGLGPQFALLAKKFELRACWSSPIVSSHDAVLGTFAMYYREPRSPTLEEIGLINLASHVAGIAIERRQAEQELQRSVSLLKSTFDSTADGLLVVDHHGRMVSFNQRFVVLWRLPPEIIASRDEERGLTHVLGQLREPDAFLRRVREIYADPEAESFDTLAFKDGRVFERYSCPHRVEGVPSGRVWSFRDVTARRQLEQQFLQSQKMEAFGQLAGGVAHDFNNLLTVILGNLSLIKLGDMPPDQQQASIDDCFRAAQRAANLTGQLLTFSRRQPVEPRDLDLNEVVANMTKMLQRLIGEHIQLETSYAAGGAPVHADPGMMEQTLMNLALNSRDAMSGGGKLHVSTARVEFDAMANVPSLKGRAGNFVRLTVRDSGFGIAPEHLPHIFEPFFTTKEVGKGTGLGLATVFGIVEQHSGWIDVESVLGGGTAMHVYLPAAREPLSMRDLETRTLPRGGRETILLVEDEAEVRGLMGKLLENHGYCVHVASNATQALEIWQRQRASINLLLTDMVMPGGVGGRELARRLLADRPDLRVIYCSGYTDEMLGADLPLRRSGNFLEKPFDVHAFLARVRNVLDAHTKLAAADVESP
jgi:signal transduction histidine kinase/ActR/RegA family two-component response regulator